MTPSCNSAIYGRKSHLLFEVSPIFLIHENQVKEVLDGELLVDVTHGRREVVPRQEHPDRDTLASHWGSVHDLVLGNSLVLRERVRTCQNNGGLLLRSIQWLLKKVTLVIKLAIYTGRQD